jgi:hypothetical protein
MCLLPHLSLLASPPANLSMIKDMGPRPGRVIGKDSRGVPALDIITFN